MYFITCWLLWSLDVSVYCHHRHNVIKPYHRRRRRPTILFSLLPYIHKYNISFGTGGMLNGNPRWMRARIPYSGRGPLNRTNERKKRNKFVFSVTSMRGQKKYANAHSSDYFIKKHFYTFAQINCAPAWACPSARSFVERIRILFIAKFNASHFFAVCHLTFCWRRPWRAPIISIQHTHTRNVHCRFRQKLRGIRLETAWTLRKCNLPKRKFYLQLNKTKKNRCAKCWRLVDWLLRIMSLPPRYVRRM